MSRLAINWAPREPPLAPGAVLGTGAVGRRLAATVRPGMTASLQIAASADNLLIIGDATDLPWVDGACYLGHDGGLLVPTTREPSVPADLLRSALAETMPGNEFAVVEGRVLAFPTPIAGADSRWLHDYSRGVAS